MAASDSRLKLWSIPRATVGVGARLHLIGNCVKTVMHGGVRSLYPDFTPYVAKYGDNGRAFSSGELDAYFHSYRERSSFQEWLEHLRVKSNRKVRRAVLATLSTTPALYRTARIA